MTLATLLLLILPRDPWPVDYVDCVEVNTVTDSGGCIRFTQTLWVDFGGPNQILGWRFTKREHYPIGGWSLFEDEGRMRAIRVWHVRESTTDYDPEVIRRKTQPLIWRRGFGD